MKVHRTRNANTQNWISLFPDFMQLYISNVVDVPEDGHCGFRVVGSYYGWNVDSGWRAAREDLAKELRKNGDKYDLVLSPFSSTSELLSSVVCQSTIAETKNWLIIPYMGNVISSCYKVVVVLISKEQCLTFFPLKEPLSLDYNQSIMVFGYINDSHFIRLELKDDSPLPPVSKMWLDHHHANARAWQVKFAGRMKKFVELSSNKNHSIATVEIID